MRNVRAENYVPKKNAEGADVYCPLTSENEGPNDHVDPSDDCIEKDVVERYSGNIDIQR